MSGFFVFEAGACLWLTITGALFAGMAIEPKGSKTEILNADLGIVFVVLSVFCAGLVLVRAIIAWGTISLAAMIVLGCGLAATFINAALNRVEGRDWIKIPTPIVGAGVSLCATVFICVLIFPTIWELEYEEYSYGTEVRSLEYICSGSGVHLVERVSGNNYTFQYSHKAGDVFGNHRYILNEDQVVWLDEDADEEPHVEGEVTAMVKVDPISNQPIETQNGKTFRPTALYVAPSDVWVTDQGDYMG